MQGKVRMNLNLAKRRNWRKFAPKFMVMPELGRGVPGNGKIYKLGREKLPNECPLGKEVTKGGN